MHDDAVDAAVALLAPLRLLGGERPAPLTSLPAACRPESLDDAARIQAALRQELDRIGLGKAVGWKIGCTTAVMQHYLDIPHPCAGTLFANRLYRDAVRLRAADYHRLGLECELAVTLGADLPGRPGGHDAASVHGAVAEWMTSVEIVEHRFEPFDGAGTPSLIADDFFSAGCLLGAPTAAGRIADPAALTGGFHVNGAPPDAVGTGEAILGHPLDALAWLADYAARAGTPLASGQVVTLGSVVKTIYPMPGECIEARFEGLSPVTVTVD